MSRARCMRAVSVMNCRDPAPRSRPGAELKPRKPSSRTSAPSGRAFRNHDECGGSPCAASARASERNHPAALVTAERYGPRLYCAAPDVERSHIGYGSSGVSCLGALITPTSGDHCHMRSSPEISTHAAGAWMTKKVRPLRRAHRHDETTGRSRRRLSPARFSPSCGRQFGRPSRTVGCDEFRELMERGASIAWLWAPDLDSRWMRPHLSR